MISGWFAERARGYWCVFCGDGIACRPHRAGSVRRGQALRVFAVVQNITHLASQGLFRERLGNESRVTLQHLAMQSFFRVAGGEKHFNVGAQWSELIEQISSALLGHY